MSEKDKSMYEKAADWVRRKGYSTVKVNIDAEDFEKPASLSHAGEAETVITPDLTAMMRGNKCYFDIALKTDDKRSLVTRWKLFDRLAAMREGKLVLFTPHGHRAFVQRLVKGNEINAVLVNL